MDWVGQDWIGLGLVGLDWIGLGWVGFRRKNRGQLQRNPIANILKFDSISIEVISTETIVTVAAIGKPHGQHRHVAIAGMLPSPPTSPVSLPSPLVAAGNMLAFS